MDACEPKTALLLMSQAGAKCVPCGPCLLHPWRLSPRSACPLCLAAVCLCGSTWEGKRPGLAHLIPASVGRKLGVGGRWVSLCGRDGHVSFPPQLLLCTSENKPPLWGRKHREELGWHSTFAWAEDWLARRGSGYLEDNVGQHGGGRDQALHCPALLWPYAGWLPPG